MIEATVCQACGVINDHAIVALEELDAVKDDAAQKARRIKQLQGERAKSIELDPHFAKATEVLLHWQRVCSPTAREPLSKRRVEPVIARLRGRYFAEELMLAADGYARFPYLVRGRRSHFGTELDRSVDADLIYRTPQNVDRGLAMARVPGVGQPHPVFVARVPWDRVWHENRRLIMAALRRRFGGGLSGYAPDAIEWPCPFCQQADPQPAGQETPSLTVFNDPGRRIAECFVCHVTDARLLGAITDADSLL